MEVQGLDLNVNELEGLRLRNYIRGPNMEA